MRILDVFAEPLSRRKAHPLIEEEREGFLEAQRLAYRCCLEVARELQVGWTEKQTSRLMDIWLKDNGVGGYFHRSFAWFGNRTSFWGFKSYFDFLPSSRRYNAEDVVILDTAPIFQRFTADVGFCFSKTPNPELARARKLILELRESIRYSFELKKPVKTIWQEVDRQIHEARYSNCYEQYPFSVLGHRVHSSKSGLLGNILVPFSLEAYVGILKRGIFPELMGPWNTDNSAGYWAIEPHFGNEKFGIKFEEILVHGSNGTQWIDDSVPHLNLPEGFY